MNWEKHFRKRVPHHVEFGAGEMRAPDLLAINDYFHRTAPKTPKATALQSDWAAWWVSTGDPDNYFFSIPDAVFDEARNRRLAFNLANATTPEEKKIVEEVAKTGMTAEAARGEPERRDPATGQFFVPPEPILPNWFFPVVVGAAVLGLGVPFLKKLILP
jgi:hypothetical protein